MLRDWFKTLISEWGACLRNIFRDQGVILFFIALPLSYPIVYTLIYNPEVVKEVPMAIVDYSRTVDSRTLVRMVDADEYTSVYGYATDLQEARQWMKERKVYGILEIPHDYANRIGRSEQAVLPLYCDMSLLLRYRSVLFAMTDIQLKLGNDIRTNTINGSPIAFPAQAVGATVDTEAYFIGNPTQGFASFIMIGIVVLILQQSIILGMMMLGGGVNERRLKNRGIDPDEPAGPQSAVVLARALCVAVLYLPLMIYMLHFIPEMFSLPHYGSPWQYLPFIFPLVLASAFMGQMLSPLVTERESSFLVWVFTSVVFLFLSGLTWPRSAMSPAWYAVSSLIPATWGVDGFIQINSNMATLNQVAPNYTMMWVLTVAYYIIAVAANRISRVRYLRRYGA
ncbi:MAG: ABC transporter permease [Bacteroides sp.]|nr:ABC transporter permease [Bacteroides sp.]